MKKYIDLEKFNDKLTIAQLKKAIEQDEISAKQKETEELEAIKSEFENTYLKYIDEDSFFGKTLNVYCLKDYVRSDRTTDWSLIYYFEGTKISFSQRDIHKADFNPSRCGNSFSGEDLRSMSVITKEEYDGYVWHYNQISKQLEDLIR